MIEQAGGKLLLFVARDASEKMVQVHRVDL